MIHLLAYNMVDWTAGFPLLLQDLVTELGVLFIFCFWLCGFNWFCIFIQGIKTNTFSNMNVWKYYFIQLKWIVLRKGALVLFCINVIILSRAKHFLKMTWKTFVAFICRTIHLIFLSDLIQSIIYKFAVSWMSTAWSNSHRISSDILWTSPFFIVFVDAFWSQLTWPRACALTWRWVSFWEWPHVKSSIRQWPRNH